MKQINWNSTLCDWQYDTTFAWNTGSIVDDKNESLRIAVTNIILELGVPASIKGYFYLREAIIIKFDDPALVISMTKILYPSIAKMFDTSASLVDRAIRHAIKVAWSRSDMPVRQEIFCYPAPYSEWNPTNSEFIATIVDYLKVRCNRLVYPAYERRERIYPIR